MCQIINKSDTVNKNMTAIIKAYISRNVATLYVPSKSPMGDQSKLVFKNTHFYTCIEGKVCFIANDEIDHCFFLLLLIFHNKL